MVAIQVYKPVDEPDAEHAEGHDRHVVLHQGLQRKMRELLPDDARHGRRQRHHVTDVTQGSGHVENSHRTLYSASACIVIWL